MQRKETETDGISFVDPASRLARLFYQHAAVACEGAIKLCALQTLQKQ